MQAVAVTRRADRSVVLGVGLALVGALYAGAMARNYRLSRALVAKDKDMASLVMKVAHPLHLSALLPMAPPVANTWDWSSCWSCLTAPCL